MNNMLLKKNSGEKLIIKRCHCCGSVTESKQELQRCIKCNKSFLPLGYFQKVHDQTVQYDHLFAESHELHDEDIIKGLYVIW